MKGKIINPFITGGYVAPDYFCNRQEESERLLKAIASRRNVALISLRRIGKTGLLKHVSHLMQQELKTYSVIYADLMPTMNGNQMLNALSSALIRLKRDEKNFFEKLLSMLSSLRPRLSFDNLTGQPSIDLQVETPADIQFGLDNLLGFISEIRHDIVFMLDEFQQVSNYPEKNIEQMLRSIIQSHPSIPFIFSGSSRHMLEPMFLSAGRPFYQSSELMYLDKIPGPEYCKFISRLFESGARLINDKTLELILEWTRGHTFYVQYVCNLLFETGQKVMDADLVNHVFHRILIDSEPLFSSYRSLIPSQQFKLLQALAMEEGVTQPMSGTFIRNHDLNSASSVAASLKSLTEKEMIVKENDKWIVYDVFFARWMEYNYRR